jgi:hypothetical protein
MDRDDGWRLAQATFLISGWGDQRQYSAMSPERFAVDVGVSTVRSVSRWTSHSLVTGVVLLPLGYALVFASGYGGNSTGGSEIVWRIGGLVVYAAFLVPLFAAIVHVVSLVVTSKRRRRPPTPAR